MCVWLCVCIRDVAWETSSIVVKDRSSSWMDGECVCASYTPLWCSFSSHLACVAQKVVVQESRRIHSV